MSLSTCESIHSMHCCVRLETPRLLCEQPEKRLLGISNMKAGRYIQAHNSLIKIDNVDKLTFNEYAKQSSTKDLYNLRL